MVTLFQGVISGQTKRLFTLYAAHDTTVAPMALALQLPLSVWPQYASRFLGLGSLPPPAYSLVGGSLYFGLLRDTATNKYYVEVLHDKQPAQMAGCGSPCEVATCACEETLSSLTSFAVQPVRRHCQQVVRGGRPHAGLWHAEASSVAGPRRRLPVLKCISKRLVHCCCACSGTSASSGADVVAVSCGACTGQDG